MVKVDRKGRLTRRKHKYLKKLVLYSPPAMPRSDRDQQRLARDQGVAHGGQPEEHQAAEHAHGQRVSQDERGAGLGGQYKVLTAVQAAQVPNLPR